jgi:hypothetical protein
MACGLKRNQVDTDTLFTLSQTLEQGQFEVYTEFSKVTLQDGADTIDFCTAEAAGIDTIYLIDSDGGLRPSSVPKTNRRATLVSNGLQIQKFVNRTLCTAVPLGCYTYCRDTCFRSVRYELDPSNTDKIMLQVCRVGHGATCSLFAGSLRINNNENTTPEPRTFIAHLPILVGYTYKATFIDNQGRRVMPTVIRAQYEESLCPDSSNFAVYLDGKLPSPPQAK